MSILLYTRLFRHCPSSYYTHTIYSGSLYGGSSRSSRGMNSLVTRARCRGQGALLLPLYRVLFDSLSGRLWTSQVLNVILKDTKGVFKRRNKSDLLQNDRVLNSWYVYRLKCNATTGGACRFKSRMGVCGFDSNGKGFVLQGDFSTTPVTSVARDVVSMTVTNDPELHSVDIEQAFTQVDKLEEAAHDRHFITP